MPVIRNTPADNFTLSGDDLYVKAGDGYYYCREDPEQLKKHLEIAKLRSAVYTGDLEVPEYVRVIEARLRGEHARETREGEMLDTMGEVLSLTLEYTPRDNSIPCDNESEPSSTSEYARDDSPGLGYIMERYYNPSSPMAPHMLAHLVGEYELFSTKVPKLGYGNDGFDLTLVLDGDELWGKFKVGRMEGVLRLNEVPRNSLDHQVPFAIWMTFQGHKLVKGEIDGICFDFQGVKSKMETYKITAYDMKCEWDLVAEELVESTTGSSLRLDQSSDSSTSMVQFLSPWMVSGIVV
ncbi:hypothetical protein F4803DRAFT_572040 [Xylaria telfairii]|nr:hypothetical protein F4803DRAFT_572040 [Xylaria telfairii]